MLKKYLRDCRKLIPIYGKRERIYLKQLEKQLLTFQENSEAPLTYDKLVSEFGTPKDTILSYYETFDNSYLLQKANHARLIRHFLFSIILAVILFLGYRSIMLYKAFQEVQDSVIIYEETTIEED
jgi:hypothetical protein